MQITSSTNCSEFSRSGISGFIYPHMYTKTTHCRLLLISLHVYFKLLSTLTFINYPRRSHWRVTSSRATSSWFYFLRTMHPYPKTTCQKTNSILNTCPRMLLNASGCLSFPVRTSSLGMSCLTMTLGALSNITALATLAKSQERFRRQTKAPFLPLAGPLLLADLWGHIIPEAFSIHHMAPQSEPQPQRIGEGVLRHKGLL